MKANILIVDNDKGVRELLSAAVESDGCLAFTAESATDAMMAVMTNNIDAVLLEACFENEDGIELIKRMHETTRIPVIVVSSLCGESDKIAALDAGADDYVTKPFSVGELLARLRAALRRVQAAPDAAEALTFINGPLTINYLSGDVLVNGNSVRLTPIEYRLLCLLAKNVGKVLTHTFITREMWGNSRGNVGSSIRVLMAMLRKKIDSAPNAPRLLQTHTGVGYRMVHIGGGAVPKDFDMDDDAFEAFDFHSIMSGEFDRD